MIRVDRSSVAPPKILDSENVRAALEDAAWFFRSEPEKRRQRRYHFKPIYAREAQKAVLELFHGKCAFCESGASGKQPIVHHEFRPLAYALDQKGEISPAHYWWLFGAWSNQVAICMDCSSLKGFRFPVAGERAPLETPPDRIDEAEERLLLDPCADEPAEHFVFDESGRVASSTRRGIHTIETFGLNRDTLVRRRAEELDTLRREWTELEHAPGSTSLDAILDGARPFAGMRRFFVKEWMEEARSAAAPPPPAGEVPFDAPLEKIAFGEEAKRHAFAASEASQTAAEDYSLENVVAEEYFSQARLIRRIEIENFRILGKLDLEVPGSAEGRAPWLMLLGENGTGKSSILQAIALALAGGSYRERLPSHPGRALRHGAAHGRVRIHLSGMREPIELAFDADDATWHASTEAPKVLLLGYGATRLLPRGAVEHPSGAPHARLDNLFNPFVPLLDVTPWLRSLTEERFDAVASGLRELLDLRDDEVIVRTGPDGPGIEVRGAGTPLGLEELSDGYQSVLALACDVMAVMLERWSAVEVAEGIVLLDEIGAHLHPRWQMRIIDSLRRVFPRVQFIATTHNPLCLRGLEQGEVVVLRRRSSTGAMDDQGLVWAQTDLPSVRGLRVDQLLTSEHFGLSSTIDPALEAAFQEYYALRAEDRREAWEQLRLEELAAELEQHEILGATRRERLLLELVDDYLARAGDLIDPDARAALKEETRRRGAELWERARGPDTRGGPA